MQVLGPLPCGLLLALSTGMLLAGEAITNAPALSAAQTAKFKEIRAKAEAGDAEAQLVLGCMYDDGVGVPQSSREAFKWWLKAADQGLAVAQNNVAAMYAAGVGMEGESDLARAAEWYRKSAEQGYPLAQATLGWMHYSGHGVAQDKQAAVQLWRKAGVQSALDKSTAQNEGRVDLVQQAGRDSARSSLGLYVSANVRKFTTRSGGSVTGALFDVLPDQILYIGEDGVPCRQLRFIDASDEVQKEFGYSVQKAEDYHRRQWEEAGVFRSENRAAEENFKVVAQIVSEYRRTHARTMSGGFESLDVANDVWNQINSKGISAKVRLGNTKEDITSIREANHAWVVAEVSPGTLVALEPQAGKIIPLAENRRYYHGYDLPGPTELKQYERVKRDYNEALAKKAKAAEEYRQVADRFGKPYDNQTGLLFNSPAERMAREPLAAESARRKAVLEQKDKDLTELANKLDDLLARK